MMAAAARARIELPDGGLVLGLQVEARIVIEGVARALVTPPAPADLGAFVLLASRPDPARDDAFLLTLLPAAPDTRTIPSLQLEFVDASGARGRFETAAIDVLVAGVDPAPAEAATASPMESMEFVDLPAGGFPFGLLLALCAGLALAGALAWRARRARSIRAAAAAVPAAPAIDPALEAMRAIDRIVARLAEPGADRDALLAELADVVRSWFARVRGRDVLALTAEELSGAPPLARLEPLFLGAEQVKYAGRDRLGADLDRLAAAARAAIGAGRGAA